MYDFMLIISCSFVFIPGFSITSLRSLFRIMPVCSPFIGSVIVFLSLGLFMNGWWYSWLTLLLIPILTSLIDAIRKRKLSHFAFPVLVVFVYLAMGMFMSL